MIKSIPAFQATDGSRFYSEQEAREHERRYLFSELHKAASSANPTYAKLEDEVLNAFLEEHGRRIGEIANDPLRVDGKAPYVTTTPEFRRDDPITGVKKTDLVAEVDKAVNGAAPQPKLA